MGSRIGAREMRIADVIRCDCPDCFNRRTEERARRYQEESEVPNRLYGAEVNEEGEVV